MLLLCGVRLGVVRGFGGVRRVFRLGAPCGVGVFLLLESS